MRSLILCALAVTAPGCAWLNVFRKDRAEKILERQTNSLSTADRVVIDYRLIDQIAGDEFASETVWRVAQPCLSHDQTALLAENGLRVGVVSGMIPDEFTARVSSERHAVDPRAIVTRPGEEKVLPINGPVRQADIQLARAWKSAAESITVHDAECGLAVTCSAAAGDRIRLKCQWALQHGSKQPWLRPNGDKTQFVWNQERSRIDTSNLNFEVELGRGDFLVVGPAETPANTLGDLFFFEHSPGTSRQRFFVLRGQHTEPAKVKSSSIAATAGN